MIQSTWRWCQLAKIHVMLQGVGKKQEVLITTKIRKLEYLGRILRYPKYDLLQLLIQGKIRQWAKCKPNNELRTKQNIVAQKFAPMMHPIIIQICSAQDSNCHYNYWPSLEDGTQKGRITLYFDVISNRCCFFVLDWNLKCNWKSFL